MAPAHVWYDETCADTEPIINVPSGKGERLIIIGCGGFWGDGKFGWVDGSVDMFKSKRHNKKATTTGDYHESMTATYFEQWFDRLLPLLPDNAVVVVDRAKYHLRAVEGTRIPKKSWKKSEMQAFFQARNIPRPGPNHRGQVTKAMLMARVQEWLGGEARAGRTYVERAVIEEKAQKAGRGQQVLVLPVGHCELNPIEMAWSIMKRYVCRSNTGDKKSMAELRRLMAIGKDQVTPQMWERFFEHVRKIERGYVPESHPCVQEDDRFIIRLDGRDEDSEDEESSDDYDAGVESDSEEDE